MTPLHSNKEVRFNFSSVSLKKKWFAISVETSVEKILELKSTKEKIFWMNKKIEPSNFKNDKSTPKFNKN